MPKCFSIMAATTWFAAVAAAALATGVSSAQAAPVVMDRWFLFETGPQGSAFAGGTSFGVLSIPAPGTPWEITLAAPARLIIVDGFDSGDRYEVFDFGVSLGLTSPPTLGSQCSGDELACLANQDFSRGAFLLAAGDHALTGIVAQSPFPDGSGFFIIEAAAAPEPASYGVFALGVVALSLATRCRV